jgi:hypothetical protein
MPIIKGTDNAVVVVFGDGDIPIVVGNLENQSVIGSIDLMMSKDCHPIGEVVPGSENMIGKPTSDLLPLGISPGVRLVFPKVESVDGLINALNELKVIQGW